MEDASNQWIISAIVVPLIAALFWIAWHRLSKFEEAQVTNPKEWQGAVSRIGAEVDDLDEKLTRFQITAHQEFVTNASLQLLETRLMSQLTGISVSVSTLLEKVSRIEGANSHARKNNDDR